MAKLTAKEKAWKAAAVKRALKKAATLATKLRVDAEQAEVARELFLAQEEADREAHELHDALELEHANEAAELAMREEGQRRAEQWPTEAPAPVKRSWWSRFWGD